MPTFEYGGSITTVLFANETLTFRNGVAINRPTNFLTTPIRWNLPFPPSLTNTTVPELNRIGYRTEFSLGIRITGTFDPLSGAFLRLQFGSTIGELVVSPIILNNRFVFDYTNVIDFPFAPQVATIIPFNIPDPLAVIQNFTYTLTLNVNLRVICENVILNDPVCLDACSNCSETSCICESSYINYCLDPNATASDPPRIVRDQACQDFFADYIRKVGPLPQLDRSLESYCQSKYAGFEDLFNDPTVPEIDIQLCACHMPAVQYRNFARDLFDLFPGVSESTSGTSFGLIDRCLVPACSSSIYKSVEVGSATCPLPQCFNIASFNNNGTFDDSTVIIDQSAECAAFVAGEGIPEPEPLEPPVTVANNTLFFIGIGVVVLIIIIIIIIAISYSRR